MAPHLTHHPLQRADGSCAYSDNLYTILAGINGPVEVQRRDELPEEAAIEINVRPSAGIGGPAERWLESTLHAFLKSLLLVHMHPRTLMQITLQITKEPARPLRRGVADVALLPALANAAVLGLVDAGVPLATSACAVLAVVDRSGDVCVEPGEKELGDSQSVHALAYDLLGENLLNVSVGKYDAVKWDEVLERAQEVCVAAMGPLGDDVAMAGDGQGDGPWLRKTFHDRTLAANAWREGR